MHMRMCYLASVCACVCVRVCTCACGHFKETDVKKVVRLGLCVYVYVPAGMRATGHVHSRRQWRIVPLVHSTLVALQVPAGGRCQSPPGHDSQRGGAGQQAHHTAGRQGRGHWQGEGGIHQRKYARQRRSMAGQAYKDAGICRSGSVHASALARTPPLWHTMAATCNPLAQSVDNCALCLLRPGMCVAQGCVRNLCACACPAGFKRAQASSW